MESSSLDRTDARVYDPVSPMRNLAFWQGALRARQEVIRQASDDYEKGARAIQRIETIIKALSNGQPLEKISEYHRWLAQGTEVL